MLKSTFAIAIVLALWTPNAIARESWGVGACAANIKTLCAGVNPGESRVRSCVRDHLKDLSEPCQVRLAKLAATDKACAVDIKEKCSTISLRRHRITRLTACLKPALASLSDPCKDVLTKAVAGAR